MKGAGVAAHTTAPARSYELADRRQRACVDEQVPVEDVEQDVREIIDADELVASWNEIYPPDHARRAWRTRSLSDRVELPC